MVSTVQLSSAEGRDPIAHSVLLSGEPGFRAFASFTTKNVAPRLSFGNQKASKSKTQNRMCNSVLSSAKYKSRSR